MLAGFFPTTVSFRGSYRYASSGDLERAMQIARQAGAMGDRTIADEFGDDVGAADDGDAAAACGGVEGEN